MKKLSKCERCDATENIEKDHIIMKTKGGSDDASNKRLLCRGCHDYRHAKDNILKEIQRYDRKEKHSEDYGQFKGFINRLTMLQYRLAILEKFNTPELIRERQKYKSYWEDPKARYCHWYKRIKVEEMNDT